MKLSQLFLFMCALMEIACLMSGQSLLDNQDMLEKFVNTILPLSLAIFLFETVPHTIKKIIKNDRVRILALSVCTCMGIVTITTLIGGEDILDSTIISVIWIVCLAAVVVCKRSLTAIILRKKNNDKTQDVPENP